MPNADDEREDLERAKEKGWLSPLKVLAIAMSADERDQIRRSLGFEFEPENRGSGILEAWEIIDTDRLGVVARIHSSKESFDPSAYISWRDALRRVLDWAGVKTLRGADVENLEKKFVEVVVERELPEETRSKGLESVLKSVASAIKHSGGESFNWVGMVGDQDFWEGFFGAAMSLYKAPAKPAVDAMLAICLTKHVEPLDPTGPPETAKHVRVTPKTPKSNVRLPKPRSRHSKGA